MDGILSLDSADIKTGIKRKDILINKPQVDATSSPKIEAKSEQLFIVAVLEQNKFLCVRCGTSKSNHKIMT